jgi:hypothetical protein
VPQAVKYLPSKHEALSSNSSMAKGEREKNSNIIDTNSKLKYN